MHKKIDRIVFWIKKEFFHIFPVFLFFATAFLVINLNERFLFKRAGLTPFTFLEIVLAAVVVAKVFLVIDHLKWIDLFSSKPLIYSIIWKTFFYWVVLIVIRISIRFLPYLWSRQGLEEDFFAFVDHFHWRFFISIQAYYLMLLFIYTTFVELSSKIGSDKMKKLFFGK